MFYFDNVGVLRVLLQVGTAPDRGGIVRQCQAVHTSPASYIG